MDSTNDKLIFQLENEKTKKVVYKYEIELAKFQKETIENEDVSFFYAFKDMGFELEDTISSKLKLSENKDKICFVIKYLDKNLYQTTLDVTGIDEKNASQNEVQLYYAFALASRGVIDKIAETHKSIILSNVDKK